MFRQPTAEKDTIYSFYPFEFDLYDEQEIELRRLVELVRESVEYDWISCFKVDLFSGELSEVALQEKGFNLIESIRFDAGKGPGAIVGIIWVEMRFEWQGAVHGIPIVFIEKKLT